MQRLLVWLLSLLNELIIMKSYGLGIIVSLLSHTVLVILVVWGWQAATPQKQIETPQHVKAVFIELEQKAKPSPDVNKKRQNEIKKKEQQRRLAEKKKREQQEKAKQLALKKAKEEKARKEKALQEQREKERKEELRKQQERQEELRKELEKEQQQQQRQKELEQAIAAEKARKAAEQQASEDERVVSSYISIIRDRVSANWSRPPSARNGMEVTLRIQLVPTGEVISVDIVTSSGDAAYDRSTVRAVKKAEKFPEIKEMESRIFEQYYRTFSINFSPEDLRQ